MQLKSEAEKIEVNGKKILHTSTPTISNKTAYSCYFEAQLDFKNFGKNRKKHNIICNQQLLKQLEEFTKEGIQFFLEATNEELINNICLSPHKSPHDLLVWEHCTTKKITKADSTKPTSEATRAKKSRATDKTANPI